MGESFCFVRRAVAALLLVVVCGIVAQIVAAEKSPVVTIAKRKLEAGNLTPEAAGRFIELICTKGDADDLALIVEKTIAAKDVPAAIRSKAVAGLLDATLTRKVRPSGNLDAIATLIDVSADDSTTGTKKDGEVAEAQRIAAMRLAGLWKVAAAGEKLRGMVAAEATSVSMRRAAVDGLVALADDASRAALAQLATSGRGVNEKIMGVAGLAQVDAGAAAPLAAGVLKLADDKTTTEDLAEVLGPFLDRTAAADALAKSFEAAPPPADAAKRALQTVYAMGHGSSPVAAVLSKAAGLGEDPKPPTADEVKQLLADVASQGSAERGEAVFRRADLSCMKCHSINKAGGEIGPDLAAVGSISPADFLLTAVLDPDQAIKEVYQTRMFITVDGETVQGIVVKRGGGVVEVKEATGGIRRLPEADIDQEKEGKSLMPKGLVKFMTRQELVDLVRFLSELGKPGKYPVRTTPLLARWRLLKKSPDAWQVQSPDAAELGAAIADARERWQTVYVRADGAVPVNEFARITRQKVLYLYGEIDVTSGGSIDLSLGRTAGVSLWIDDRPAEVSTNIDVEATPGRHKIVLRVDTAQATERTLCVEPHKAEGSGAEFACVGGP